MGERKPSPQGRGGASLPAGRQGKRRAEVRGRSICDNFQKLSESFKNRIHIFDNSTVTTSKNLESLLTQHRCSLLISLPCARLEMCITVDLDNQSFLHAEKIHDMRTDRHLSAKFQPMESSALERIPQKLLTTCLIPSQFTSERTFWRSLILEPVTQHT